MASTLELQQVQEGLRKPVAISNYNLSYQIFADAGLSLYLSISTLLTRYLD